MVTKIPYKYTKKDMINFANYYRNGITNLEYCEKDIKEHLHEWFIKTKL